MNDEVYFWHADIHRSSLQVSTIILGLRSHTYPKYLRVYIHIFAISSGKHGDRIDFLPVKHKRSLQVDTIFLGVHSQACPKHPKQQVCYIFQYLN